MWRILQRISAPSVLTMQVLVKGSLVGVDHSVNVDGPLGNEAAENLVEGGLDDGWALRVEG